MNDKFLNHVRSQGDFEQVQKKQTSNGVKLTNTVYKVLEFFPESDPLKNRAKDKALTILEHPTCEDIDILLGYLWIGKMQGWLNSVNCMIISHEYEKLKKEISPAVELTIKLPGIEDYPEVLEVKEASIEQPTRQTKILDFLEKRGKAQVMDLQAILPSITKRTIRRDLDELLGTGRIVRMGEFNQVFYQIKR